MSVLNNPLLIGFLGAPGGEPPAEKEISRSVRFNSADSAFLSKNFGSAGNRKTFTHSFWVKRTALGSQKFIFAGNTASNFNTGYQVSLINGDTLSIRGTSPSFTLTTSQVFRDPSAWYHIVVSIDTTQSTDSNRVKLYVNGVQVEDFGTSNYPSQNADLNWNGTFQHRISGLGYTSSVDLDGYLADVYFIDGQALDPTSFGEFNTNGIWQPIEYTGAYGTNGFHLEFSDNSTAAALGTDTSGNNNTWTVNNISVAAGADNDSLVDSPTNGNQTDTGVGGEVVGNYCTWNPLAKSSTASTFSNGNLDITTPGTGGGNVFGTFAIPTSGKWYWEVTYVSGSSAMIGISPYSPTANYQSVTGSIFYYADGRKFISGTGTSYGASYAANDVIGVAVDTDASSITFYKNNTSQGSISISTTETIFPSLTDGDGFDGDSFATNFGQRPFGYPAPAGYKALCTANLPNPTIADGSTATDVVTYTGNGTTQTLSGLEFSPDLVWIKRRDQIENHVWTDTLRGAAKALSSDLTAAEKTVNDFGLLTAFTSDGFTVTQGSSNPNWVNALNSGYVAWTWDAGNSDTDIPAGSLNSTSYNQSQNWSSNYTCSNGFDSNAPAVNAFDGNISTESFASANGGVLTMSFSPALSGEIVIDIPNGGTFKNSSTDATIGTLSNGIWTYTATNLPGIKIEQSGGRPNPRQVRLDGKILVDSSLTPPNIPSIDSTVRTKPEAGFSIVSYTGTNSNASIAPGLNVTPEFIIFKSRDTVNDWYCYHKDIGRRDYIYFNRTDGKTTASLWQNAFPTDSVFYINDGNDVNKTGDRFIAYCFASVEGYSAFGSYTGNGNANGPFVYTGFRPRWIMTKRTDNTGNWTIIDTAREGYNVNNDPLYPNLSNAEGTAGLADILSNGLKLRTNDISVNASNGTYIYAAFAENPFALNARAR